MFVITAKPTFSDTGEMTPQVRCGCGAQITSWESAPDERPGLKFIYVTCPICNAKTNIRFTEVSLGNWTVEYLYQAHPLVFHTQADV